LSYIASIISASVYPSFKFASIEETATQKAFVTLFDSRTLKIASIQSIKPKIDRLLHHLGTLRLVLAKYARIESNLD